MDTSATPRNFTPAQREHVENEIKHALKCRSVAWQQWQQANSDEELDHWNFRVDQWNAAIACEVAKLYGYEV